MTPEGFGYDPQRGELWFAGETAEAVWLELEARRRALAAEVDELDARVRRRRLPTAAYSRRRATRHASSGSRRLPQRLVETLEGVAADRFEAPLRARADAGATRTA